MGSYSLPIIQKLLLPSFWQFLCTTEHWEIPDPDRNVVAYRLTIREFLVEGWYVGELDLLNHYNQSADRHEEFPIQPYATLPATSLDVCKSKEYEINQDMCCTWMPENKSLSHYLVHRLTLIHADGCKKPMNMLPTATLELLCHSVARVAINHHTEEQWHSR